MSFYVVFENQLLTGAHIITTMTSRSTVRVAEVLSEFVIDYRPDWIRMALEKYTLYEQTLDLRDESDDLEQELALTSVGRSAAKTLIADDLAPKRRNNIAATSPEFQDYIVGQLKQLEKRIQVVSLSQRERAQALSLTEAAIKVATAPEPIWHVVRELLYIVSAIATLAPLVTSMIHSLS